MRLILIVLSISFFVSCAQKKEIDTEGNIYDFKQIQESCQSFIDLGQKAQVSEGYFVLFMTPNSCPRCELSINPLISYIKKENKAFKVVGYTFYSDQKASTNYIQEKNISFDLIKVGSESEWKKLLYTQNLKVPSLAYIDAKNGRIHSIKSLLGIVVDQKTIPQMVEQTSYIPFHDQPLKQEDAPQTHIGLAPPHWEGELTEGFGTIQDFYFSKNQLFFLSNLYNKIEIHDYSDVLMVEESQEESMKYVSDNIPSYIVDQLQLMGMNRVIYLRINEIEDHRIILTTSLPNIWMDIEQNDTTIGYMNKIVYLKKDWSGQNQYITPELDLKEYNIMHPSSKYINANSMILPLKFGWPSTGTENLKEVSDDVNPLVDSFYDNKKLAIYYKGEQNFELIFPLPEIHRSMKTGYSFVGHVFDDQRSNIVYSDGYSGVVYEYSNNKFMTYEVFKVDPDEQITAQTSFDNDRYFSYLKDLKEKVFYRKITALHKSNDTLSILLKERNQIFAQRYYLQKQCELLSSTEIPGHLTYRFFGAELIGLEQEQSKIKIYKIPYKG